MLVKILGFIKKHKIITAVILITIFSVSYFIIHNINKGNVETRYILGRVERGNLISTVSGTGQVSALNQIEIKTKTSGEVIAVYVKTGQEVKTGTLIAQLDTHDAARAVRDAEINLETAKLELEKLLEPVDELTLLQAETSLLQAENSKLKAEYNLEKSYEDGYNTVSTVFLNLPSMMEKLNDIFFTNSIEQIYINFEWYSNQISRWANNISIYKEDALAKYQKAKSEYDLNFENYKKISRDSNKDEIIFLISQSYNTAKSIAESIKSFQNYLDYIKIFLIDREVRIPAIIESHRSSLDSLTQNINTHLTSLLSARQSIKDYQQAVRDAETLIKEKKLSYAKTTGSPDELAVRAKRIAVQQKEDALLSAKQTLANCYIRASFDGIIVKVNVKKGDNALSGTSIATLVTKQKIAEISLNEVDAAKINIGQKATLSFDAIEGLTITGEVSEIDILGSVSQGVVTYAIKIAFDTQDDRVKPGMSVSANIITEAKQNVLLVNSSAVKFSNNVYYVEVFDNLTTIPSGATVSGITFNSLPQKKIIEIGISNDSLTEVKNGLKEGEIIIVRTNNFSNSSGQSSTRLTTPPTPNVFQMRGRMFR